MEIFFQIIGWVGTAFVLSAYFLLVSSNKITEDSRIYQILNLLGAIGVGFNVFHQQAWPAFGLQVVWGIISIVAITKMIIKRRK